VFSVLGRNAYGVYLPSQAMTQSRGVTEAWDEVIILRVFSVKITNAKYLPQVSTRDILSPFEQSQAFDNNSSNKFPISLVFNISGKLSLP